MTKIMTPSTTIGQIDKAVANYRALLEKHAPDFSSDSVQTVLGQSELAGEMFSIFRRRVEMISSMIIRRVKVDRTRTPQAVLDATGRKQYITSSVVEGMPKGEGEEVEVVFFQPEKSAYNENGWISDDNLEKQYELWGLTSVDPYSLSEVNKEDPAFADKHPNATHWKDENGNWCYTAFSLWHDGRGVGVFRDDYRWSVYWWFAGLRKISLKA